MGQPVLHFEVIGKDADTLRGYYAEMFGWEIDASNPMNYGIVPRYADAEGAGIGGGIGPAMEGYGGHVTFYVGVPDVEAALVKAESLGGKRLFGPEAVPGGPEIGQFADPEGHLIGLIKSP